LTRNAEITQIEKLIQGGTGLGRTPHGVVLVPYTIPGETVEVRITRRRRDYSEGEPVRWISVSPERRAARCGVFTRCGGCQLQHLPEPAQLHYKTEALRETLARTGRLADIERLPPISSPAPFHYRTRCQLKVHRGEVGFYERESHRLVPIGDCPLLIPSLNRTIALITAHLPLDGLREIEIHGTTATGEVLVVLKGKGLEEEQLRAFYTTAREEASPDCSVVGLIVYGNGGRAVWGRDYLVQEVLNKRLRVSDRSFCQVNGPIQDALVRTVLDRLSPDGEDRWLELYSGAGLFTLFLAEKVKEVTAVEENPFAVEDARWNIQSAGLSNVRLIQAAAETALAERLYGDGRFSKIFLDPPREGAGRAVIEGLVRLNPRRIDYLSCDPATLARDLRMLSDRGYRPVRIQPIDLFPQTGHLETLAEIVK
jgi:23S rRNA (uracil1939-C5)-methyltransferase